MKKDGYVHEILDVVLDSSGNNDPVTRELVFKRLFLGYGILTEEISQKIVQKEYKERGFKP